MKILLNAVSAKKNAGGAYQISVNFILGTLKKKDIEWFYIVSEDVDALTNSVFNDKVNSNYFIFPSQPDFFGTYWSVKRKLSMIEENIKPDIVFSLAAPSYFSFKAPEVIRFANAWVTNPNEYATATLSTRSKIRNTLYCSNQKRLLRKRNFFITQSETVKNGLLSIVNQESHNIKVVSNVLPFYFNTLNNDEITKKNTSEFINIASVAVPFPHKNLDIIPDVLLILKKQYKIENVRFFMTLPPELKTSVNILEKLEKLNLTSNISNFGYCSQKELVDLYANCDLFFLPSLLETFSASLLEAMFFDLAIVASDFEFNREVTGSNALYFNPTCAFSAAEKIARLVLDPDARMEVKMDIKERLNKYISFDNYLDESISFLRECYQKSINH